MLVAISLLALSFLASPSLREQAPPLAVAGRLDASSASEAPLLLTGEWELLEGGPAGSPRYEILPGSWPEARGFRAYALRLRGLDPALPYAVKVTYIDTSYRLLADGEEIAHGGIAGRSPEEARPAYGPCVAALPEGRAELELRLEVANFAYSRGGPFKAIALGEASLIERRDGAELFLSGLACVFLLILGGIFLQNAALRRKASPAYFGLACVAGAASVFLLSGELLAYRLFPGMDWVAYISASAFVSYAIAPLVFLTAHELFGGLSDRAAYLLCAPIALALLAYLAIPLEAMETLKPLSLGSVAFYLAAALALSARAVAKGYPYARAILTAFLFVTGNALATVLFHSGRFSSETFLPLSFLHALAGRGAKARLAIDLLSYLSAIVSIGLTGVLLFADSSAKARAPAPDRKPGAPEGPGSLWDSIGLSPREAEAASLALEGKSNKEIAESLCVSVPTVKTHLSRVFSKAGVKSRGELFAFAGRAGVVR